MRGTWRTPIVISALMLSSALAAILLQPDREKSMRPGIGLARIVPAEFGEWKEDGTISPLMPPPEVQQKVDRLYDETLARTYINQRGARVMLSIAYGGDQTGRLRVHRPESCYTAQGFVVRKVAEQQLSLPDAQIPVKRLLARSGLRTEPITYWIRIGQDNVTGLLGQRISQLKAGITGEVSDGLIFRVSTVGVEPAEAFALHDGFVTALLGTLTAEHRALLVGTNAKKVLQ